MSAELPEMSTPNLRVVPPEEVLTAPATDESSSKLIENEREATEMAVMASADMNFALGFEKIGDKARAEESRRKAEFAMNKIEREIKEDGEVFRKAADMISAMLRDIDSGSLQPSEGVDLTRSLEINLRGVVSGQARDGSKFMSLVLPPRAKRRLDRFKEFLGMRRIQPASLKGAGWFADEYLLPQYATNINNLVIQMTPFDKKIPDGSSMGLRAVMVNEYTWQQIKQPRLDD